MKFQIIKFKENLCCNLKFPIEVTSYIVHHTLFYSLQTKGISTFIEMGWKHFYKIYIFVASNVFIQIITKNTFLDLPKSVKILLLKLI